MRNRLNVGVSQCLNENAVIRTVIPSKKYLGVSVMTVLRKQNVDDLMITFKNLICWIISTGILIWLWWLVINLEW